MPKTSKSNRPPVPRGVTKLQVAGSPLRSKLASARTKGGRLTYAGADLYEQRSLRAEWDGAAR